MKITQCLIGCSNERAINWIEKENAIVGKNLYKKYKHTGWKVLEVWQTVEKDGTADWEETYWRS